MAKRPPMVWISSQSRERLNALAEADDRSQRTTLERLIEAAWKRHKLREAAKAERAAHQPVDG